jgi:hypothetical protein
MVDVVWLFLFLSIYWWGGDALQLVPLGTPPSLLPYFLFILIPMKETGLKLLLWRGPPEGSLFFPPTFSKAFILWGTQMGSSVGLYVKQMPKYLAALYALPSSTKGILFGIMLSEGHLEKGTNLVRFCFIQSIPAHAAYFWSVYFTFIPYCNSFPSPSKVIKGVIYTVGFRTRSLPCFTEFYDMFYLNGAKRVPDSIYSPYLTPAPEGKSYCPLDLWGWLLEQFWDSIVYS